VTPRQHPDENQLGHDVTGRLPDPSDVTGLVALPPGHDAIWQRAEPHLKVRSNDGHTIYAYGLARALVDLHPEADPEIVLPAILLHDIGWSQVAEIDILSAIAPGGGRPDLVLLHEKEGARIAREVLEEVGHDAERTAAIVAIIDGHDSRREAISLDDALMKDADKLWRLTPHGIDTVMDWFGLTRPQAHRLIASRVHDHLLTDAGRTMAQAFGAVASIDSVPQRLALG
jgi:HD superfamily phosphodiesterase